MEMIFMNIIRTIDLWTEQNPNHIECFSGAFVDGFENENVPFNSYKIVRNCNCIITSNQDNLNISNKHNAIIFYKDIIANRWHKKAADHVFCNDPPVYFTTQ